MNAFTAYLWFTHSTFSLYIKKPGSPTRELLGLFDLTDKPHSPPTWTDTEKGRAAHCSVEKWPET